MQQIVDEWRFEPHGVDHRHEETEKFCLLTGLKVNRNAPLVCLLFVLPIGTLRSGDADPTVLPLMSRVVTLAIFGTRCRE
jgi:hypothetical protein